MREVMGGYSGSRSKVLWCFIFLIKFYLREIERLEFFRGLWDKFYFRVIGFFSLFI